MVGLACVAHLPSILAALTKNRLVVQFAAFSFLNMCLIQAKILGCSPVMLFNLVLNAVAFWKFSLQVLGPRRSILEVLIHQRGQNGVNGPESDLNTVETAASEASIEDQEEVQPLIKTKSLAVLPK